MQLFDLPPELVKSIFSSAVESRDFAGIMRLRRVDRNFKHYTDDAIFRHRLLSQFSQFKDGPGPLGKRLWPASEEQPIWLSYVYRYLAYQASREGPSKSLLGRIYHVAQTLCEQSGETDKKALTECLESLIRLAAREDAGHLVNEPTFLREKYSNLDIKADVCVAAVYLGRTFHVNSSIKECIKSRGGWTYYLHSGIFGDGFNAAMFRGDLDMIKVVLSHTGEYIDGGTLSELTQLRVMKSASDQGHRAAFDFALDMEPLDSPDRSQTFGSYRTSATLASVLHSTPWPDVYNRVAAILGPHSEPFERPDKAHSDGLDRCAASGKLGMVRHFLNKGASPNASFGRDHQPLLSAVRSGEKKVVEMLLDAGADPNLHPVLSTPHQAAPHTPLAEAAWKGSVAIATMLLDRGADANMGRPTPIAIAVAKEDIPMFRLLREHGARLDTPETGGWAMALARSHQLSHMVELLVREGVGEDVVWHAVASKDEIVWQTRLWPRRKQVTKVTHRHPRGNTIHTPFWAYA